MNGIHLACLGAGLILRGLRILNNAICKCDAIVREPLAAVKNIGVEGMRQLKDRPVWITSFCENKSSH
jgi:hypothetical protein